MLNILTANLKRVKGQYTDTAVTRCSLIAGSVGKGMEDKFMGVVDSFVGMGKKRKTSHQRDLQKFLKLFTGEKLFMNVPGRHHSAFPNFRHLITLAHPERLKERLRKYSAKLDNERLITKSRPL